MSRYTEAITQLSILSNFSVFFLAVTVFAFVSLVFVFHVFVFLNNDFIFGW